jgi:hypothetical protein
MSHKGAKTFQNQADGRGMVPTPIPAGTAALVATTSLTSSAGHP